MSSVIPGSTALGGLFDDTDPFPDQACAYPEFRYMGSKHRLLPWIHDVLSPLGFESAADPFSGSGCVAYLLKAMGKRVLCSDSLNFPTVIARGLIANQHLRLSRELIEEITRPGVPHWDFVQRTFGGIFFDPDDLLFLDLIHERLETSEWVPYRDIVLTALIRACMKRQPRGVFTVGNREDGTRRYDDGRRDMRLSIREHFREQADRVNKVIFDSGVPCRASQADALSGVNEAVDLVYLDPPYVPRSDDNCYMKRYHFLEGLSCYWRGAKIMEGSKVRKIEKPFTPFGYRSQAVAAFDRLFAKYAESTIVLSYSSNGFPDRDVLERLIRRYKPRVEIYERPHRYHFGTHRGVSRAETTEYLMVGTA